MLMGWYDLISDCQCCGCRGNGQVSVQSARFVGLAIPESCGGALGRGKRFGGGSLTTVVVMGRVCGGVGGQRIKGGLLMVVQIPFGLSIQREASGEGLMRRSSCRRLQHEGLVGVEVG